MTIVAGILGILGAGIYKLSPYHIVKTE
jgi:hypothetical protein